jgi:hypothetical protein
MNFIIAKLEMQLLKTEDIQCSSSTWAAGLPTIKLGGKYHYITACYYLECQYLVLTF